MIKAHQKWYLGGEGLLHFHLHPLLNHVHKYTSVYDNIAIMALNGVVAFGGVYTVYSSLYPSPPESCLQRHGHL